MKWIDSKLDMFMGYFSRYAPVVNYLQAQRSYHIAFGLLAIVIVFASVLHFRWEQLSPWLEDNNPSYYVDRDTPILGTLDSYKWIRYTEEVRDNTYVPLSNDEIMYYPDGWERPKVMPLIAHLNLALSKVLPDTDTFQMKDNIYFSALIITPLLATMIVVVSILWGMSVGYLPLGILAGITGSYAPMFYLRSTSGRFDTDLLNVALPMLIAIFMALIPMSARYRKEQDAINGTVTESAQGSVFSKIDRFRPYIFSALAGYSTYLLYLWYEHQIFNLIYAGVLLWYLIFSRYHIKEIAISMGLFILLANPLVVFAGISSFVELSYIYLFNKDLSTSAFPNVYNTISEAIKQTTSEVMSAFYFNGFFVMVGVAGFLLFALANMRAALPLMPLLALTLLGFLSSPRFTMYGGPLIGIGFGYFMLLGLKYIPVNIEQRMTNMAGRLGKHLTSTLYLGATTLVGLILILPAYSMIINIKPTPAIPTEIFHVYEDMKQNNIVPEGSAIYTWWDYGLIIEEYLNSKSFHDGMSQSSPKTYFVARSMVSDSQQDMYNIISYLSNNGMTEINASIKSKTPTQTIIQNVLGYDQNLNKDDVYLMYTADMIGKFGAIQFIGNYDIENKEAKYLEASRIPCSQTEIKGEYVCAGSSRLNIQSFSISTPGAGVLLLKDLYIVNALNGTSEYINTPFNNGVGAILIDSPWGAELTIAEDDYINSNLIQMFLLDNYDRNLFELVAHYGAVAKVYRVLPQPLQHRGGNDVE